MAKSPLDLIRSLSEKYPEWEKAFLFGDHEVYRVKKKVYVWLGEGEKGGTYISVKLKDTQWIEESYRHTAPKKLLKQLAADRGKPTVPPERNRGAAKKKPAAKKKR